MKGLIYKDLMLSRKYYIMAFLYCFMFALLAFLVRVSMICGNLSYNEEILDSLGKNMYILRYIPCNIFLLAFSSDGGAIFSDLNSGWQRFCSTTAIGEKRTAGAKLLSRTVSVTAAYLVSLLYITVLCLAGGDSLTWNMISNATAIYFVVLGAAFISIALTFVFQKKQTVEMFLTAAVGIMGLSGTSVMMIKLKSMNVEEDIDLLDFIRTEYGWIFSYLLPAAAVFLTAAAVSAFFISVRVLQRREN
ncbi:MAG: hypothetical protein IJ192_11870 [Clostridia bacterium]|nr:hypothetical protein [Clostridia bacterium]